VERFEFLMIWKAWDRRPGDPVTAARMESACGELAAELGLRQTFVRDALSDMRRDGLSHGDALDTLFANAPPRLP
jgi:hypothetical protein